MRRRDFLQSVAASRSSFVIGMLTDEIIVTQQAVADRSRSLALSEVNEFSDAVPSEALGCLIRRTSSSAFCLEIKPTWYASAKGP